MNYPFELPQLPYEYSSLEPYIDAQTMEIHYTKHHQTYVTKLNESLEKHTELHTLDLKDMLSNINDVPEDVRTSVRNNGGGHMNHSFFWENLSNPSSQISEMLAQQIDLRFGSFEEFKQKFTEAAMTRFGSGWAWLVLTDDGKLDVYSTPNQDSPYMDYRTPLLGLDVWEHAYYLKYQNRRPEYIENFWNMINWERVSSTYDKCVSVHP